MSEREKKIIDALYAKLPKLSPEKKERALGVMEGMALMADLIVTAEKQQPPAQMRADRLDADCESA